MLMMVSSLSTAEVKGVATGRSAALFENYKDQCTHMDKSHTHTHTHKKYGLAKV